jgi:uncharacterized membrane protein YkvA (DUF1232 family)
MENLTKEKFWNWFNNIKIPEKDIDTIIENEKKLKTIFKEKPFFRKYSDTLDIMISLLKDFKNKRYKDISSTLVYAIVFSLVYIIEPIDFIWDDLGKLGYFDDFIIFKIVYSHALESLIEYKNWKDIKNINAELHKGA